MSDWTDAIVGDRMAVDSSFSPEIDNSQFSRQEWGLIMTAVEFDIEHADDAERARLVANTDSLPDVMPELDRVAQMQKVGPAGMREKSSVGVLDSLRNALGLGADDEGFDEERVAAAERLTDSYASRLQTHLESEGKWERIRATYRDRD